MFMEYNMPQTLQTIVNQHLERRLRFDTLFEWINIAEKFRFYNLSETVSGLIYQNFQNLWRTKQFLEINSSTIKWLIKTEKVIASERCMLEALTRWYEHDTKNRQDSFRELLAIFGKQKAAETNLTSEKPCKKKDMSRNMNIAVVSVNFRQGSGTWYEPRPLISLWLPFMDYTTQYDYANEWRQESLYYLRCTSSPIVVHNCVHIMCHRHLHSSVVKANKTSALDQQVHLCFNLSAKTFHWKAPVPDTEIYEYIVVGVCIYAFAGGRDGNLTCKYDTRTDQWEKLPSSHGYHGYGACVVLYGMNTVYLIGGGQSRQVEKYDTRTDTWSAVRELPFVAEQGNCLTAFTRDGKIVVIIHNKRTIRKSYFTYSPMTDQWQEIVKPQSTKALDQNHFKENLTHILVSGERLFTCRIGSGVAEIYEIDRHSLVPELLHMHRNPTEITLPNEVQRFGEYTITALSRGAVSCVVRRTAENPQ